jgi:anhydro-N-acetylmuramic acid kinase
MKNKFWHVIGLMSGTSLDGVDLVYVKFIKGQNYSFEILKRDSINYSEIWKNKLQNAFNSSGENLIKLDVEYGTFLGELIQTFISKNKIDIVDFIASHGHTIFHRPEQNYTFQIGSGAVIAEITKIKVICDFRVQDVALGGQGAPLVPIGDQLLFSDFDFCLNLGGFANISFQNEGRRKAFDICPVNIVLNNYTRKNGLEFDDKGKLAKEGVLHKILFEELNGLPFYLDDKPKSLGYEFVVETVLPMIESYKLSLKDVLNTFTEHSAYQISKVINRNKSTNNKNVLLTGGGAFNDYLIERISLYTNAKIIVPDKEIINFKEALIFALLGVLKDQNEVNCLQSVTGAKKDHSSGVIFNV